MLEFREIKIEDAEKIKNRIKSENENSSENSFVNLVVWQKDNSNMWAENDGMLFLKFGWGAGELFSLPFCEDLEKGIAKLKEYSSLPLVFWAQEGEKFSEFKEKFADKYTFEEIRNTFDYLYLRDDLALLSGSKYHSKRNHISAFSKKFSWEYKEITKENIKDIKECAALWYNESERPNAKYIETEKTGLSLLLDNMEELSLLGGVIYAEGKAVAFTLGSALNDHTFDIHIEKALASHKGAYAVINNEFAKRLEGFKYLNREDDLGIEGLRKAKLSYKPEKLIKKYICREKI